MEQETDIRLFTPNDRDWLIAAHADHYAKNDGFDDSFAVLVTEIIDAFIAGHDPVRERGWVVWQDGARQGCIFCVRLDDETAKLRLFLLSEHLRGQGLGRRLLAHCMGFARQAGYLRMQLWTHESHRVAGALYAKAGWVLRSAAPVRSFGQELVEQHWDITL